MDIFLSKSPKYRYNKLSEPLQAFFRSAPVGFAIVDSDNFIVEGNDKFCEMFGCIEAEIVNRKITDLACDDPLHLIKDNAEKEIEIKYRNLKGTIEFQADTEFCFDMNDLVKIVDPPEIEKLDGNNKTLEYGGFLFQIVHMHRFYKLQLTLSSMSKLVLLEIKGKTICFLVDKVIEMIAAGQRTMESLVYVTSPSPFLKGTIEYDGRELLVPSLANILSQQ